MRIWSEWSWIKRKNEKLVDYECQEKNNVISEEKIEKLDVITDMDTHSNKFEEKVLKDENFQKCLEVKKTKNVKTDNNYEKNKTIK